MRVWGSAITMLATGAFLIALVVQADASLLTIGTASYNSNNYNLIYDNDSPFGSIVYLDYSETGDPAGYVGDGSRYWAAQSAWANSLNTVGLVYNFNAGYSMAWSDGWRLPSTVDTRESIGFDVTSSELGHLFYTELGNSNPQSGNGLVNTGPFTNLQTGCYWSGTDFSADYGMKWFFSTCGLQCFEDVSSLEGFGLAVRSGQLIETVPVPEPATIYLLILGIAALCIVLKLKKLIFQEA